MKHIERCTYRWVVALFAAAIGGFVLAQAPAVPPPWPQQAVADPMTLGFTRAGLDAIDARMKQSIADGDTAG